MNPELQQLREEYERRRIGEMLYTFLGAIVKAVAPVYPPAIYSSSGTWDRASLTDLLHDWIARRLLRGDLEAMLVSASSVRSLQAQLSASLKQLIINGRQRDSAVNLYLRTVALLAGREAFQPIGSGTAAHRRWTLAAEPVSEPSQIGLTALIAIAYELSDQDLEVIRYGAHSLKSSPILREPQLERFLIHLLARAAGTLDATQIALVQQHRFSLLRQPPAEVTTEIDSGEPPVELQVLASSAAEAVLAELELRDIEALRALNESDWVVSRAAERLGGSAGKLNASRDRVAATVAQYATSREEALQIVKILLESLFS